MNALWVFSAANMAGYMGVDSMRNDIASDLAWFSKQPKLVLVNFQLALTIQELISHRDLKTEKRISLW